MCVYERQAQWALALRLFFASPTSCALCVCGGHMSVAIGIVLAVCFCYVFLLCVCVFVCVCVCVGGHMCVAIGASMR